MKLKYLDIANQHMSSARCTRHGADADPSASLRFNGTRHCYVCQDGSFIALDNGKDQKYLLTYWSGEPRERVTYDEYVPFYRAMMGAAHPELIKELYAVAQAWASSRNLDFSVLIHNGWLPLVNGRFIVPFFGKTTQNGFIRTWKRRLFCPQLDKSKLKDCKSVCRSSSDEVQDLDKLLFTVAKPEKELSEYSDILVICEGEIDAALFASLGIEAVGVHSNHPQTYKETVSYFKTTSEKTIVLWPDADVLEKVISICSCSYVYETSAKDPSDYFEKYGKDKLLKRLEVLDVEAEDFFDLLGLDVSFLSDTNEDVGATKEDEQNDEYLEKPEAAIAEKEHLPSAYERVLDLAVRYKHAERKLDKLREEIAKLEHSKVSLLNEWKTMLEQLTDKDLAEIYGKIRSTLIERLNQDQEGYLYTRDSIYRVSKENGVPRLTRVRLRQDEPLLRAWLRSALNADLYSMFLDNTQYSHFNLSLLVNVLPVAEDISAVGVFERGKFVKSFGVYSGTLYVPVTNIVFLTDSISDSPLTIVERFFDKYYSHVPVETRATLFSALATSLFVRDITYEKPAFLLTSNAWSVGKTTFARLASYFSDGSPPSLVTPSNGFGKFNEVSDKEIDASLLDQTASNVLLIDNIQRMNSAHLAALLTADPAGGVSVRKMYTQKQNERVRLHKKVIFMTGLSPSVAPDILSRIVSIELSQITNTNISPEESFYNGELAELRFATAQLYKEWEAEYKQPICSTKSRFKQWSKNIWEFTRWVFSRCYLDIDLVDPLTQETAKDLVSLLQDKFGTQRFSAKDVLDLLANHGMQANSRSAGRILSNLCRQNLLNKTRIVGRTYYFFTDDKAHRS